MKKGDTKMDFLKVMAMNRKDRRAFSRSNNGLKIKGTNIPFVKNPTKMRVT